MDKVVKMSESSRFHWADYLLFSLSLLATLAIGVVFAIKDRWSTQSSESYLMGNRNLNWFMVGISYSASVVSAVMFVGVTAELYYTGMQFMWVICGISVSSICTTLITVPKFFRLGHKLTSAYEYLEYRFNLPVRMVASGIFTLSTLLFMAVILYAPSIILSEVSGIGISWCMVIGASVCMIYTGFGGMKAVIWTDNLQTLLMVAGLLVLAVKGTINAGGIRHIYQKFSEGQRTHGLDIDPSPWKRYTVWNLVFMSGFAGFATSSSHQMLLQRFLTIRNLRKAQLIPLVNFIFIPAFIMLMFIITMGAFATLGGNEPLLYGKIQTRGQIFPYYMMTVLGEMPGMPGLIVASAYAAALSSLSSGQNALAAVILEDFFRPIHRKLKGRELSGTASGNISRITGVLLGFVVMALGLLVLSLDDMVFSLTRTLESFISGPIFVLMFSGFFCPHIESWGALVGCISSVLWAVHMYVGSLHLSSRVGFNMAPLYKENFTIEVTYSPRHDKPTLYDVSYTWYVFLDVMIGLIVASLVSIVVQYMKYRAKSKEDKKYSWRNLLPDRTYLYTVDDFLVAVGRRKVTNNDVVLDKSIEERSGNDLSDIECVTIPLNSPHSHY